VAMLTGFNQLNANTSPQVAGAYISAIQSK
jgi:hypothetical protein